MKKRNGKQWMALLLAMFLILIGTGVWIGTGSVVLSSLIFVVFVILVGLLAFLAISRAWAVGQDLLALSASALVVVALLPLLFTPLLGSAWLQNSKPREATQRSLVQKEVDVIQDLRLAFVEFNFQTTPLLLRLYLLVVTGATLCVAAALFVPRPSQKLPRAGRWLETSGLVFLGAMFLGALLVTSGISDPEPFIENIDLAFIAVLLVGSLVAYYRFGVPVLGLATPGEIPPKPRNKKPSATQKEALRRKGQSVRQQAPPAPLPDLTKESLAAIKAEPEPEPVRQVLDAPPGSPGSLEPSPRQKQSRAKTAANKTPGKKRPVPTKAGWYPDPFSSEGERYWDGSRWGQQTR